MAHLPRILVCLVAAALCGFAPACAAESAEPHHVTAVRFWSLGEVTRIAIETDGDFSVRSDRLENPDRIFFDLSGMKPALGSRNMTVIPVSDRYVRQIRVAEPQHGITRVVLDLAGAADATLSRLSNPSRLIIELRTPNVSKPDSEPIQVTEKASPSPAPAQRIVRPVERHTFIPPPAPSLSALSPSRARQISLVPPPIIDALAVPRPLPAIMAATNAKLIASVFGAGAPPAVIQSPAPVQSAVPVEPSAPVSSPITVAANVAPNTSASNVPPVIVSRAPVPRSEVGLPAKRNASGDPSMIRVLGLKVGRIVLDPGHGGQDTGTIGPDGLREKDLVLDVAKRLGALIEQRMGSEVIYTRSDDTFIPLERRTEIANEAKADLFLSIHANSSTLRTAAGVETYYLNFTTSKSALEVAARENSGSQQTVYELQDLLEKIALKDKVEESREFATRIQSALFNLSAKSNARAKDRGVRKAPFVVLIGASMPSVLAEIGFISNPHDESIMKRSEYRDRLAEALYKGLASYAGTLSHFQVAQRR